MDIFELENIRNIFKQRNEAVETNTCAFCGKEVIVEEFRDTLSRKEYYISGICQECQDKVFGAEDDDR